ncbi:MAG: hypothetical protein LiPW15_293 [Parcubacteria group bacterium LiPW_15]|nr:MAG: hypothetical protein LiPW15_293 [Parcubacteria group bacterium LiPW_15]
MPESKRIILRIRAADNDIFEAMVSGKKKIETRAATARYKDIKAKDVVILVCGKKRIAKTVKKAEHFPSVAAILKKYKPETINPKTHTAKEATDMWYGFPGYKEKIKKFGLIVITLE